LNLTYKDLTIRDATAADAEQLAVWWNDGAVMAHAGFPNGLGIAPEQIVESLAKDDDKNRRHIIEYLGKPIGEMNYRTPTDGVAEIGIKICDSPMQEKGLGTTLLTIFIDALFRHMGYEKILIDGNLQNTRAQHVYEKKLSFRFSHIERDSWTDQLGQLQSSFHYEMDRDGWLNMAISKIQYRKD